MSGIDLFHEVALGTHPIEAYTLSVYKSTNQPQLLRNLITQPKWYTIQNNTNCLHWNYNAQDSVNFQVWPSAIQNRLNISFGKFILIKNINLSQLGIKETLKLGCQSITSGKPSITRYSRSSKYWNAILFGEDLIPACFVAQYCYI